MRTYEIVAAIDMDEVIYPWHARAHDASTRAGITGDCTRSLTWTPYEEYGCSREDWYAALAEATFDGYLYNASPMEGAIDALSLLREVGAQIWIITARGTASLPLGKKIRELTYDYIDRWEIPHDGIFFSSDKEADARRLGATHAIDDNLENYKAFERAGAITFLHDQPWNMAPDFPVRRVQSLSEFAERILVRV